MWYIITETEHAFLSSVKTEKTHFFHLEIEDRPLLQVQFLLRKKMPMYNKKLKQRTIRHPTNIEK